MSNGSNFMNKVKEYLLLIVIFLLGMFFTNMYFQNKIEGMYSKINSEMANSFSALESPFKKLSDSLSAKSSVSVVVPPNIIDKLFNTATNKQYKQLMDSIPKAIQQELKNLKIENKVTEINKTSLIVQGDSVYYKTEDGTTTKTAKVVRVSNDSSLLVIVPQEIEITSVRANPDKNNPDKVYLYFSAYNKTTGDSLNVTQSTSYQIPRKVGFRLTLDKPFAGADYDVRNNDYYTYAGIFPLTYKGKRMDVQLAGISAGFAFKQLQPDLRINIIRLQMK